MPRFKKPPIIEAWLLFEFPAPPNKTTWGLEQADKLASKLRDQFPHGELFYRQEFEVEELGQNRPLKVSKNEPTLEKIKLTNGAKSRVVQIADQKLAFNVLTGGSDYPGFAALVDEALEFVDLFEQTYGCGPPNGAVLHYKDIVRVSVSPTHSIDLEDYFNIIRDLPVDPFGNTFALACLFQSICPSDGLPLKIDVKLLPNANNEFRFELNWEKACASGDFSDRKVLRSRLSETSEFMVECFEKSITQKTRELFEPTPELPSCH